MSENHLAIAEVVRLVVEVGEAVLVRRQVAGRDIGARVC